MKAVVQRVLNASVTVAGSVVGKIDRGLLVLVGIEPDDAQFDIDYIVKKCVGLRIFEDEYGKMNESVADIEGEVLLVSQFTLLGDARKGFRPSFSAAAPRDAAIPLFEKLVEQFKDNICTQTGIFGADMKVSLINDGPVTILLDSRRLY